MSYIKANEILPEEILVLIQNYVDGEYLYIPRKEGSKKHWGDNTKNKSELAIRNESIYDEYKCGISIKMLANKYFLSEKSIQRIVCEKKKNEK